MSRKSASAAWIGTAASGTPTIPSPIPAAPSSRAIEVKWDERDVQEDADRRDQMKPCGDQGHGRYPDDRRGQHSLSDPVPDSVQAGPPPRIGLAPEVFKRRRCTAGDRLDPGDRRAQLALSRGYQPNQGTDRQEGELTANIKKKEWVPRQGEQSSQGQRVGRPGGAADDRGHAEGQRHDGRANHRGSKTHENRVAERGQRDTAISQSTG